MKNDRHSAILNFISAKFVMSYPCVSPYILFYIQGPANLLCFLIYINITKLLKFKMAAKRSFKNRLLSRVNQIFV